MVVTVPAEFLGTSLMEMSILAKRYEVLDPKADPMALSIVSAIVWSPCLSLSSRVWPHSISSLSVIRPPATGEVVPAANMSTRADRVYRRCHALGSAMASFPECVRE
jgi:hypothetical protein